MLFSFTTMVEQSGFAHWLPDARKGRQSVLEVGPSRVGADTWLRESAAVLVVMLGA